MSSQTTMNKHTPGPWHVAQLATNTPDAPGTERAAIVADTRGNNVASISLRGGAANDNANAALIAAAPTLLVLLTDIEAHLSGRAALHSGSMIFEEDAPALEIIRKAINQARGK